MQEEHRLGLLGINIGGLDPAARERIEAIGFDRWLDEVAGPGPNIQTPDLSKAAIPSGRRCALGSKCFRAHKRVADYVREGNGRYCSPPCHDAAQAANRRKKAQWAADNPEMV